ncbi:uncharacterized protein LOC130284976 isoform X2 [Hyla sarda]|uniref:uncharacterized protein LOC130284976 isoform X2 n=1 Tax=Hyla sarda TaxID=327740 RepID=UPI0024C3FAE1|nr:uncharacterized protein LOC130284976 isoform X2 [Hyla sarda]
MRMRRPQHVLREQKKKKLKEKRHKRRRTRRTGRSGPQEKRGHTDLYRQTLTMKRVVAIFSRDGDTNYRFLSDFLKAEGLEVRSCIITNNGQKRFREEASTCHFAILYHTKNRGRLNITDVTDSLYDEEITELNTTLGKKNVVVVVDDLDCSSSEKKMEILAGQPSILNMAAQLFLVSKADKISEALLNEKLQQLLPHIMKKVSETSEKNVSKSEPNTIIIWSRKIIHGTLELLNKAINYLPIPSWCKQFICDKIRWWVMGTRNNMKTQ